MRVNELIAWMRRAYQIKTSGKGDLIYVEFPTTPTVRYGEGKPPHPQLKAMFDAGSGAYRALVTQFAIYAADFAGYRDNPVDQPVPTFRSTWFPLFDAIALYGMVRHFKPARIIEIGSGNSTFIARAAVDDGKLNTHITAIDPHPRRDIAQAAHTVINVPLEATDLAFVETLDANDILFFDGSHQTFQNSDVTVFFLDVLPRLRPGVIVQIHDIFLPYDYPTHWLGRYYSEQYMLACWLLAGGDKTEILLPNGYMIRKETHLDVFTPFMTALGDDLTPFLLHGGSFWLRVR